MSETSQAGNLVFKSSSSAGNIRFVRASQMTEGETVQGEYVGSLPNRFEDTKLDYKLEEVDDAGNKTGVTIVINGAGNLGYRMANISLGSLIQIMYLGKKKIAKGKMAGKESHSFDVLTAD